MRIAVLGEPGGWHVGRLAAACERRGHAVSIVRWAELAAGMAAAAETFAPAAVDAADAIAVRGMPGISATASRLEEVIFRMDVLARLAARGTPVINSPRALEIAIDKYLSLTLLRAAGLPVPRTHVVQDADGAERAWQNLGPVCVAKPIFGSRGRGLARVTSAAEAAALVPAGGGVVYLQEFLPHCGWDARILVVGGRIFSMRRVAAAGEWRTNVSRGGRPEVFAPPAAWVDLAVRAAEAVGADVAGIDIVPTADGKVAVVEVNAVPGWRGLERVVGIDLADEVVGAIERAAARAGSAAP
jgi:ribosomal protein S6--L-glutamate ligase